MKRTQSRITYTQRMHDVYLALGFIFPDDATIRTKSQHAEREFFVYWHRTVLNSETTSRVHTDVACTRPSARLYNFPPVITCSNKRPICHNKGQTKCNRNTQINWSKTKVKRLVGACHSHCTFVHLAPRKCHNHCTFVHLAPLKPRQWNDQVTIGSHGPFLP